jgi:hypothetical protein
MLWLVLFLLGFKDPLSPSSATFQYLNKENGILLTIMEYCSIEDRIHLAQSHPDPSNDFGNYLNPPTDPHKQWMFVKHFVLHPPERPTTDVLCIVEYLLQSCPLNERLTAVQLLEKSIQQAWDGIAIILLKRGIQLQSFPKESILTICHQKRWFLFSQLIETYGSHLSFVPLNQTLVPFVHDAVIQKDYELLPSLKKLWDTDSLSPLAKLRLVKELVSHVDVSPAHYWHLVLLPYVSELLHQRNNLVSILEWDHFLFLLPSTRPFSEKLGYQLLKDWLEEMDDQHISVIIDQGIQALFQVPKWMINDQLTFPSETHLLSTKSQQTLKQRLMDIQPWTPQDASLLFRLRVLLQPFLKDDAIQWSFIHGFLAADHISVAEGLWEVVYESLSTVQITNACLSDKLSPAKISLIVHSITSFPSPLWKFPCWNALVHHLNGLATLSLDHRYESFIFPSEFENWGKRTGTFQRLFLQEMDHPTSSPILLLYLSQFLKGDVLNPTYLRLAFISKISTIIEVPKTMIMLNHWHPLHSEQRHLIAILSRLLGTFLHQQLERSKNMQLENKEREETLNQCRLIRQTIERLGL